MKILVLDIGGSQVKAWATGRRRPAVIPSGPELTPRRMMAVLRPAIAGWSRHVAKIVRQLQYAVQADYVVLGGGKAKLIRHLPPKTVRGDNSKAFLGGVRLWTQPPRQSR